MHKIGMFDRKGALTVEGFENSGADFMPQYKPYINDGKTIVTSPHKLYGNESNDLVLQLRKHRVDQVILAGMSANLCTESHMRELLEQGFRGRGGQGRHGRRHAAGGRRLPRRVDELPLHGEWSVVDGRNSRAYPERRLSTIGCAATGAPVPVCRRRIRVAA